MKNSLIVAGLAVLLSAAVRAQVPAAELAMPPPAAHHFIIESTGGKHGESWRWVAADGTRMGRESLNLRGQVWEVDSSARAGSARFPITTGCMNSTTTCATSLRLAPAPYASNRPPC